MAKGGFRGGYPGGNQMNMMKQAQKMQQDFLKMQQELESTRFEFTSGGGAVKAVILGTRQLESIEIKPEVVDPEDVDMLQDRSTARSRAATIRPTRPWPSFRAASAASPVCSELSLNRRIKYALCE